MSPLHSSAKTFVGRTLLFSGQIAVTAIVVIIIGGAWLSPGTNAGGSPCGSDVRLFSADANNDGILDISDPVWLLSYLFESGPTPLCLAEGSSPLDAIYVNEDQTGSITSDMIVDGTVAEADLAFSPVTENETDSVTSDMIVDGTIQEQDLGFGTLMPSGTLVAFAGSTANSSRASPPKNCRWPSATFCSRR